MADTTTKLKETTNEGTPKGNDATPKPRNAPPRRRHRPAKTAPKTNDETRPVGTSTSQETKASTSQDWRVDAAPKPPRKAPAAKQRVGTRVVKDSAQFDVVLEALKKARIDDPPKGNTTEVPPPGDVPAPVEPAAVTAETPEGAGGSRKKAPKRKGGASKAALKAARDEAHLAVVLEAAHTAVGILQKEKIPCSIFGSLACKLYGSSRCPKDVDLLVYEEPTREAPWTAEELKKLMLDRDPVHFYLTLPKDPAAEYRILWFRQHYLGPGCKVDLLVPGTMHLPNLVPSSAVWIEKVPLVPFSLLLLHKLQGWDDHRLAEEAHKKRKQPQDAADIKRMLGLEAHVGQLEKEQPWSDRGLFSEEFEELTRRRVGDYCAAVPKHVKRWRELGFVVPDPVVVEKKEGGAEGEESGEESVEEADEVDEALVEEKAKMEREAEVRGDTKLERRVESEEGGKQEEGSSLKGEVGSEEKVEAA
ncbi:hypothetical protein DFP72DRAFT_1046702 [Ephemerocybe angulata]|uniref:Uncharacterized protein n=1 Tax=Ephemerocybe angulata TaxID=980116 RepID=A0A8H6HU31_9AGAR|nr:hypothetical protein DFP72DRAFT_1046702 [Tulosesus angulatus]